MDEKVIILFFLFFFITSFMEFMYSLYVRNKNEYRLNEYLANISLGITSTLAGLLIKAISLGVYDYIYHQWRFFTFEMSWIYVIYAFLAYDFVYYWVHRSNHEINILWAGHSIHHSGEDFNFSTAIRIGLLAALITWPLFLPLALLGVQLETYLALYSIQVLYQYTLHTQCIPKLGILEKVFYTPSQHRIHHCKNREYIDKNHGAFLCIWDRAFGTFQEELDNIPKKYGTTNPVNSFVPDIINFKEITVQLKLALQSGNLKSSLNILFGKPFTWPHRERPAPLNPLGFRLKNLGPSLLCFMAMLSITTDFLLNYAGLNPIETTLYLAIIFTLLNAVGIQISNPNLLIITGAVSLGLVGIIYLQWIGAVNPLLANTTIVLLISSMFYQYLWVGKFKSQEKI